MPNGVAVLFKVILSLSIFQIAAGKYAYGVFINEKEQTSTLRSLFDQTEMKAICKRSNSKLKEYMSTYIYPGGIKERTVKKSEELVGFIISGAIDLTSLSQYLIHLLPYLIFSFFFFLVIVGWIFACGCRCCTCLCYKRQLTFPYCYFSLSISSIVMNISILITSIIGFVSLFAWIKGFDSAICSIMMLTNDIDKGQDIESLRKWRGIEGTVKIYDDTVTLFTDIATNKITAFGSNAWIATDPDSLFKSIDDEYALYQNEQLPNPNPLNKLVQITPTYISKHGPSSKANQYLYNIKEEYKSNILPLIDLIKDAEVIVDHIANNIGDITNSFSSSKDSVISLNDVIQTFNSGFIDLLLSVKKTIETLSQLIFTIFFVVLIVLNVSAIITLPVFIYCQYSPLKCYIGFVWCFYLFLAMFFFIFGGLMGSIGIVSNDLISVLQFFFSEANLGAESPALITGQALQYIDVCVNGNGELGGVLTPPSFGDSTIDDFYNLYPTLLRSKAALKSYSEVITSFKTVLQQSKTDFSLTTSKENHQKDDVSSVLREFTRYTYAGDYQELCILSTKDYWALERSQCPRSYLYHPPSYPTSFLADSCLIVSDWTHATVPTLYQSACNLSGGNYNSASLASVDYIDSLTKYRTRNEALINTILGTNAVIEQKYNDICTNLALSVKSLEDLLSSFALYYQGIVGENPIMSFLNCDVLRKDLQVIYEQLGGHLSYYSKSLGLCCIFISFLTIITAVLIILVQSQVKYYDKDKNEKTQAEISEEKEGQTQRDHKDKNTIQTEVIPIASQLNPQGNPPKENRSPNLPMLNAYMTVSEKK